MIRMKSIGAVIDTVQHESRRICRRDLMVAMASTGVLTGSPAWAAPTFRREGVAAAGSQVAADAGIAMLKLGGNAMDGAIAAALAMTVVDPANTSLMGRTHIVATDAVGRAGAIDGRSAVPKSWNGGTPSAGAGVVPVGGNPQSFEKALTRFGTLRREEVCRPAIALAEDGFIVRDNLARAWSRQASVLAQDPLARRLFLKPDGSPWRSGDRFRQPQLAATLKIFATGGAEGLANAVADTDAALLRSGGSSITASDFRSYKPFKAEHIDFRYRGWRVWTIGRQGYGYLLALTLAILEHFDLASMDEADRWATMLLAQRIAFQNRSDALGGDPRSLLAPTHIAQRIDAVRAALRPGAAAALFGRIPQAPAQARDTTHLSVLDSDGMAVAITQSIGPHFGSGIASPGGYLFAHSYQMARGHKVSESDITAQLPTVLESPDGIRVALGAAGGSRIPGAVIRSIVHTIDLHMPAQRAVAEPGCVIRDGYVQASSEMTPSTLKRLTEFGFPIRRVGRFEGEHLGLVHMARRDRDNRFSAGTDTYWDGGAAYT